MWLSVRQPSSPEQESWIRSQTSVGHEQHLPPSRIHPPTHAASLMAKLDHYRRRAVPLLFGVPRLNLQLSYQPANGFLLLLLLLLRLQLGVGLDCILQFSAI